MESSEDLITFSSYRTSCWSVMWWYYADWTWWAGRRNCFKHISKTPVYERMGKTFHKTSGSYLKFLGVQWSRACQYISSKVKNKLMIWSFLPLRKRHNAQWATWILEATYIQFESIYRVTGKCAPLKRRFCSWRGLLYKLFCHSNHMAQHNQRFLKCPVRDAVWEALGYPYRWIVQTLSIFEQRLAILCE